MTFSRRSLPSKGGRWTLFGDYRPGAGRRTTKFAQHPGHGEDHHHGGERPGEAGDHRVGEDAGEPILHDQAVEDHREYGRERYEENQGQPV